MAVIMVIRPTVKMNPMLIFSTNEIFKVQRRRIGTAMTAERGS